MTVEGHLTEPLTPSQLERLVNAADELSARHRLIVHVIPYTGLTSSEYRHLRRDWLVYRGEDSDVRAVNDPDSILIHIPERSACVGTLRYQRGSNLKTETRSEPCPQCEPDQHWTAGGDYRVRSIPVHEPRAVEILSWWFDRHDSIPFSTHYAINKSLREVTERAGISRPVVTYTLRWTYVGLLVSKGFDPTQISRLVGMNPQNRSYLGSVYESLDEPVPWESRPSTVSDEELLNALRETVEQIGRIPRQEEFGEYCKYSYRSYYRHFGGLDNAAEAAGIKRPEGRIRTSELIEELQRVAREVGHPPRKSDINEVASYCYTTYFERFGGIDAARDAARVNDISDE